MTDVQKPYEMITDYITGKAVPNVGAEENRQTVERFLVERLGYPAGAVQVDWPLAFEIDGEHHRSLIDLVVSFGDRPVMAIRCAAGSLESWARGILAAARVAEDPPIPLAVVSDGRDAVIFESASGKKIGKGCQALPSHAGAQDVLLRHRPQSLGKDRIRRERLILRTYDADLVNIRSNLQK
ncbi:hypothetical protein D3OALGB2SA_1073 [Olavius algarvensis associated proteobacterium Delta 3]|nr:hypothetical protein D3OALGB2SA_1073 [Olavius algarvensis associated proteobacterium Delta 3]